MEGVGYFRNGNYGDQAKLALAEDLMEANRLNHLYVEESPDTAV